MLKFQAQGLLEKFILLSFNLNIMQLKVFILSQNTLNEFNSFNKNNTNLFKC